MGKGPDIFPKMIYMNDQKVHEQMLSITNHQGNANQNHNETSPHTCQNGQHEKNKRKQMLDVEKREPCPLLMELLTDAATMKNSMEDPQKIKNRTTM